MCGLFRMSSSISIEMACGVRAGQTGPGRWKCVCVCVCVGPWLAGLFVCQPLTLLVLWGDGWAQTWQSATHTLTHPAQDASTKANLPDPSLSRHTVFLGKTHSQALKAQNRSRGDRRREFQMDFLGQTLILCYDLHWQIFDAINHIWLAGSACAMEGGERRRFGRSS